MLLQDKTVLITGGSRGIGFATAQAALKRGARVVLAARDRNALAQASRELDPTGKRVRIQPMDVTSDESVREGVAQLLRDGGRIDALINVAGGVTQGRFVDLSMGGIEQEFALNYFGALRVTQAVLPPMRSRRQGAVVFVASALGFVAYPTMANYSAAKSALVRFAEALEFELRNDGIGVTLFVPGHTDTGLIKTLKLDGPPIAKPEDVGQHIIDTLSAGKRFAVNGIGNRGLLQLARWVPWYARYILRYMALRSHPPGTFGAPSAR